MINLDNQLHSIIFKKITHSDSGLYIIIHDTNTNFFNDCTSTNYDNYSYTSFKTVINSPFRPFFSVLNEFFNSEEKLDELFEAVELYPIHREIFKSYLLTGIAMRSEPILPFDYSYEESRLYDGFYKIFNYMSKDKPFTLILDNFNLASYSIVKWVSWLISNRTEIDFRLILILDNYNYVTPKFQNTFDDILQQLELQGSTLNLAKKFNPRKPVNINFDDSNIDYLSVANNYYELFSLEYSLYYYKKHLSYLKENRNAYTHEKYCEITIRIGTIHFLLKEYDKACEQFDMLQSFSLEIGNAYYRLVSIQKLAIINILTKNYKTAETLAKQSFNLANELNIDICLMETYNILFWINEKVKYRSTITRYKFEEDFIRLTKKYDYNNMLAYFLTHTFNSISYAKPEDQQSQYNFEGHEIAKKLDNQNCILSAHLKTALVYAVRGYYDTSIQYYKKIEPILLDLKDYFRLAQTNNGIGYYSLTTQQYEKANEYYSAALENLKNSWDFDEICITLLNSGLNALLAYNYSLADKIFNNLLKIMTLLDLDRLRLTTKTRIFGIIGLNNYYLGNLYKTYSSLSKMKLNSLDTTTNIGKDDDDEFFLFNFIQGLVSRNDENFEEAMSYFKQANQYALKLEGSLKCLYPRFLNEYIVLLKLAGNFDTADKMLEKAFTYCKKNKLNYSLSVLEDSSFEHVSLSNSVLEHTWVIDAAKNQASINKLNNRIDEINFLNLFQENLSTQNEFDKALKSSMTLLQNHFSLDGYLICLFNESEYDNENRDNHLIYSSIDKRIINDNYFILSNLIESNTNILTFSKDDKHSYSEFVNAYGEIIGAPIHSLMHIPIVKNNAIVGAYICFTSTTLRLFNNESKLTSDSSHIIEIAVKQLFESLTRIKGQRKLLEIAHTDMLTGLDNRQNFYSRLSNIVFDSNSKVCNLTLFYIDLDNFKYYNDTFGHKIGDSVLIWFGEILNTATPSFITPIRYGGDEFLILLQDSTKATITGIADAIYYKLSAANGFIDKISRKLQKPIVIPEEKHLSCSMGIVSTDLYNGCNIVDFVDAADNAMYEAKKLGKHQYVIR